MKYTFSVTIDIEADTAREAVDNICKYIRQKHYDDTIKISGHKIKYNINVCPVSEITVEEMLDKDDAS